MTKAFRMKNLDCADCAAKLERKILKIDGINTASVNFIFQKLIIDYDENRKDEVFDKVRKCVSDTIPDCKVIGL